MSERKQRVKIKGYASEWMNVLSGVPQGSVLGPLLFILYINDIIENLDCNSYLYADDFKIYSTIGGDTYLAAAPKQSLGLQGIGNAAPRIGST